jgi:DNA-binding NarL/FixJ family response regulator
LLSKVKSGRPDIPRSSSSGPLVPETDISRRWILFVGSYPLFREGLALLIGWRTGFESMQAASLAQTRQALRDLHGKIDLAIVDLESLEEAGTGVISSIREAEPNVPVLVLAASHVPERHARAQQAGAHEVLDLAVDSEQIIEAVQRLLGG